ncbi:MAG: class I SAM-dependent methyltransferase [Granulosicoccus sp.]
MTQIELPEPDDLARAHSERLRALIVDSTHAAGGVISFSDYMKSALYEPGLGYYMAGAAKFGAEGDFITAPEISPLFGQSIASQIAEVLDCVGGSVLELGAGSGKLALSIIGQLRSRPDFSYFILEPSAELVQRQKRLLQSALPAEDLASVVWLDKLPARFDGVVIANEVMDALPVERFQVASGALQQLCVTDNLAVEPRPANDALIKAVAAIEADIGHAMPEGYESEVCMLLSPWVGSLSTLLGKGIVLLIDYGYPRREFYSQERNRGTLTCYYRHRAHDDPFFLPGLQDITAHVDFTAVVEAGLASDLELIGYASQSAFLLDNKLLELADTVRASLSSEADRIMLTRAIKTLTLPGEMGERFQVMALGKGYDRPLQGFRSQDLAYRL